MMSSEGLYVWDGSSCKCRATSYDADRWIIFSRSAVSYLHEHDDEDDEIRVLPFACKMIRSYRVKFIDYDPDQGMPSAWFFDDSQGLVKMRFDCATIFDSTKEAMKGLMETMDRLNAGYRELNGISQPDASAWLKESDAK